ncbi:MAG: sigma-70 family RNA polymerase sigma factor [Kofleriaceae bacterium]|nr:sigma-70 family RNA polymerase sigma factor [Kofleriaceae bacterium]
MVARATAAPRELDDLTLHRAQRGDHGAFRALVERYQGPVWELVWRMVAPAGLGARAEDLAQETFLRVYRALPGFDPTGPARLSTWIFTIATRLALNELRAGRHAARPGADDGDLTRRSTAWSRPGTPPGTTCRRRRRARGGRHERPGAVPSRPALASGWPPPSAAAPAPARAALVLADVLVALSLDGEIARASTCPRAP